MHRLLLSWKENDFKNKILKTGREEWVIGILAVIAYLICLYNDFHTDDWIVLNLMRDGFSLSDFLSMENPGRFRPLINIVIYLRYLVFGDNPVGYYSLNILLHSLVSVFFYKLLIKTEIPKPAALFSGIFFAAYFQHYEAVIWLYGIIRELAALAYISGLWYLYDYLKSGDRTSFGKFAAIGFLGLFIVEDFVIAPLVFAAFTALFAGRGEIIRRIKPVALVGTIGLIVYFTLRTVLISRPGVVETYYYPGFHMIRVLFEYLGWFIIPSPAHPYFQKIANSVGVFYYFWRWFSYLVIFSFVPIVIWAFIRSSKQVKFFILIIFITLLPIIPLNYKVSSRNIYLPSLGLAVLIGYMFSEMIRKSKSRPWLRIVAYSLFVGYMGISVAAIDITSLEYKSTQNLVRGIVDDIGASGLDLNSRRYTLLDHMPGRAIAGPAMMYRLGFRRPLIVSNDPIKGPLDIKFKADSLYNEGIPFFLFDYRSGHMREATEEYISRK